MVTREGRGGIPKRSCIWVSAGVLVSGLCDREFDCDNCPLHHALTHSTSRPAQVDSCWPRDFRYMPRHLWAQKLSGTRVRVGLTSFGAEVLNPVAAWHGVEDGGGIAASAALVTAHTAAGRVALSLPFPASECALNPRIQIDPLWPIADPWVSGYLAELTTPGWDEVMRRSAGLSEVAGALADQKRLVGEALQVAESTAADSSPRAADGGLPVEGLARVLGLDAYWKLLEEVFDL